MVQTLAINSLTIRSCVTLRADALRAPQLKRYVLVSWNVQERSNIDAINAFIGYCTWGARCSNRSEVYGHIG